MKYVHLGEALGIVIRVLQLIEAKFKVKKGGEDMYAIVEIFKDEPHDDSLEFYTGYAFLAHPDRKILEDFEKEFVSWARQKGFIPNTESNNL